MHDHEKNPPPSTSFHHLLNWVSGPKAGLDGSCVMPASCVQMKMRAHCLIWSHPTCQVREVPQLHKITSTAELRVTCCTRPTGPTLCVLARGWVLYFTPWLPTHVQGLIHFPLKKKMSGEIDSTQKSCFSDCSYVFCCTQSHIIAEWSYSKSTFPSFSSISVIFI